MVFYGFMIFMIFIFFSFFCCATSCRDPFDSPLATRSPLARHSPSDSPGSRCGSQASDSPLATRHSPGSRTASPASDSPLARRSLAGESRQDVDHPLAPAAAAISAAAVAAAAIALVRMVVVVVAASLANRLFFYCFFGPHGKGVPGCSQPDPVGVLGQ